MTTSDSKMKKSDFAFNSICSGYSDDTERLAKEKEGFKFFYGRQGGISKLVKHGFYEDNSLDAERRKKLKSEMQLKRHQSSMVCLFFIYT